MNKGQHAIAIVWNNLLNCFTLHTTITEFGIFHSTEWFSFVCQFQKEFYTWHIAIHCSLLFVTAATKENAVNSTVWSRYLPLRNFIRHFWLECMILVSEKIRSCGWLSVKRSWMKIDFACTAGTMGIEK